jgi:hypothetical protein
MGIPLEEEDQNVEKPDHDSKPLCRSRKNQINPEDLIKKWKPEVNWEFDGNFSQIIEGEVCENEGEPCSDTSPLMTKCVQKYVTITLQAVSKDRKETNDFRIPSFCDCAVFVRKSAKSGSENKI